MSDQAPQLAPEILAAIDEAVEAANLPIGTPLTKIKRLLQNKMNDQYLQDDLLNLLEVMPVPDDPEGA
jgi:peptide subunit release factor 1 (eRF1)|tara:strand:- start:32416 stop:32619 length:204 start_codon:yes stop_codon:yes gene_type:complete